MNIQFQNPGFLYALFVLLIPIIIHLFNFKKHKTIYFSNLHFIKEIELQTRSKSKLKQLLLLLSRLLALTALVFAFAQIFIPKSKTTPQKTNSCTQVLIYIDNSFSMNAEGKTGILLEQAKQNAKTVIEAYSPATEFYIVTNEFYSNDSYSLTKSKAIEFVAQVESSSITRMLSDIYNHSKNIFNNDCQKKLYIISDLQKSTTNLSSINADTSISVNIIATQTDIKSNVFIDSCWFASPYRSANINEQLYVKIINKSDEIYTDIPIQLFLNDSLKTIATVSLKPNSMEIITIPYTHSAKGIINGRIELTDYPITFDNTFFFSYNIDKSINITEIYNQTANEYIAAIFADEKYFNYASVNNKTIDYSVLKTQNLIIINELQQLESGLESELFNYIQNGGCVLFIPSFKSDIDNINRFFKKLNNYQLSNIDSTKHSIEKIQYDNIILNQVFTKVDKNILFPFVTKYFQTQKASTHDAEIILALGNKQAFLTHCFSGKGSIYTLATPINQEYTNFMKHPLFVASIYNMALYTNTITDIYGILGKTDGFEVEKLSSEKAMFTISNSSGEFEFIPQHRNNIINNTTKLNIDNNISEAGNYIVKFNNDPIRGISLNYNRNESDLECYNQSEIKEIADLSNFSFSVFDKTPDLLKNTIEQQDKGIQLWKLMIILCMLFLLTEIILIRFWK